MSRLTDIDREVLGILTRSPAPFAELKARIAMDPGELHLALLRLKNAGLARHRDGYGWYRLRTKEYP